MPTGKGFADIVYVPKPEYRNTVPTLLVELKWNKDASTSINQIKARKYPDSVKEYSGNLLLVGISYDSKSKLHQCIIEEYLKAVD